MVWLDDSYNLRIGKMDPISALGSTAKGVKQLTQAGKELDKSVGELNEFLNQPLQDQARMRAERLKRERLMPWTREQRAYARLIEKKNIEEQRERLKNDVNRTYGKGSWEELQGIVRQIEKEDLAEKKEHDKDAEKLTELKLLCFAAAFIITFFLYKAGLI